MGCAVLFLILMECCLNFLNIEKKENLRIIISIFHVLFTFYAISNMYFPGHFFNFFLRGRGGGG